ncbi:MULTISPECIES: rod-binding protein [unclassified Rhizobium]|uniref:rod-binding protein n=1 Tax=unclassified Rhizobium TaxID=2613769 RepID=UPI00104CA66F|nr:MULTISPECIES: rod-binding protein [unclassified Rhizobium]MBB3393948.1 Rod binding domain-containing protein [Rhizobium sp. BK060]MBB4169071.1 Rod binding domain-containing protein [Rhizobium sp. BK538]MBZ9789220.1 rod-binding protein [Rhizobium sp. 3T7]TCM80631.1 rod binding protein [Rhizobium sp. BK068]
MAISPPSDLVLDVVKAADPLEVQAAQDKLKANQAAFAANSLAEAGNGFTSAVDILDRAVGKTGLSDSKNRSTKTEEVPETYRKFEAMVLQNFIKNMLPSDSEEVYGKGATGDIWKGMMAEQLGNEISKGDGIGIAKQLYQDALKKQEGKVANASTDQDDRNMAMSMIDEFQRKTFGTTTADNKSANDA